MKISYDALGFSPNTYHVTYGTELVSVALDSKTRTLALLPCGAGTAEVILSDCFGYTLTLPMTISADGCISFGRLTYPDMTDASAFRGAGRDFDMLQAAIDAAHKKYLQNPTKKQVVCVYPGFYHLDRKFLTIKTGVILKMYTTLGDARDGYTDEFAADVREGRVTVLRQVRLFNAPLHTFAQDTHYDDFEIHGGVFDIESSGMCAMILACATGVLLDSVTFQNIKNNHTLQITGSKNVTLHNCMFAGFVPGADFTREMIQLEPSTPKCLGHPKTSCLRFREGEHSFPHNVVFDGCYFGKSDREGAPLIGFGHHSQVPGHETATDTVVKNCVFDDCIYAGIRFNALQGMTIENNVFRASSRHNACENMGTLENGVPVWDEKAALLVFYNYKGTPDYGMRNIVIRNNRFELAEGTDRRVFYYHALTEEDSITFADNEIVFTGKVTYDDSYISVANCDFTYREGRTSTGDNNFTSPVFIK